MLFSSASLVPLARPRTGLARVGLALLLVVCGCGSDDDDPTGAAGTAGSTGGDDSGGNGGSPSTAGAGGDAPVGGTSGGGASGAGNVDCTLETVESPPTQFSHLLQCSDVTYATNPPSGGNHYAIWPAFQSYDFPLPAGFVVHALEHGAVVFWYNCPEGCADEVAEVENVIASLPEDPLCGTERRVILVPYPELATRWGVSAWGFALTTDCVDPEAFGQFYTDHIGNGREAICNPGTAFAANPCE